MTLLGLHLSETLLGVLLLNVLYAYSAYPVFALGRMNLSFVAFAGLGAYTAAILTHREGVRPWLGVLSGIAMCVAVATPVALMLQRVRGVYLAIATINIVTVFQILAVNLSGLTGGAVGISQIPIAVGSVALGIASAVVIVGAWLFHRSHRGVGVRVQRTDPYLAMSVGVNVRTNIFGLFVISAAIGGLAGALGVYWYGFVVPDTYSFSLVILAVAMVTLGGNAQWLGPLVGALFFTIVPEWLRSTGVWRDLVVGATLLAVVIVFPEGIVGHLARRLSFIRARASHEADLRASTLGVGNGVGHS